jgi:enamine deaminase RidA (YjgF/YER057c/UK114 family)
MTRETPPSIRRINPPELGDPPGYSQIVDVSASRLVFIAGQTALDRDGHVVGRHDFAAQADRVFENLVIALRMSGCTAANLIKLTVFLTDMGNLGATARPGTASLPRSRHRPRLR